MQPLKFTDPFIKRSKIAPFVLNRVAYPCPCKIKAGYILLCFKNVKGLFKIYAAFGSAEWKAA
jgi:hypothetical protein